MSDFMRKRAAAEWIARADGAYIIVADNNAIRPRQNSAMRRKREVGISGHPIRHAAHHPDIQVI